MKLRWHYPLSLTSMPKDFGSYNLLQSDSVFLHERDTITMKQGNLIHLIDC